MPAFKRSALALATVAALLVLAAPVAAAGKPDGLADQADDRAAERVAATGGEPPAPAEKVEDGENAEKVEETEEPAKPKKGIAPTPCAEREFARVFKPWHDRALYTLAPGGDFETLAEGWTLEGGAVLAADSSPFQLGEALGASSLELPAGASALTPPICVERGFPTFRFVAKSTGTERTVVKVQVLYADGRRKATGRVKPKPEWAPTRKLSLAQGRFKIRRGRSAEVQLRFAVLSGTARLDDVYIDPRIWR
jgi:hypothetical protein